MKCGAPKLIKTSQNVRNTHWKSCMQSCVKPSMESTGTVSNARRAELGQYPIIVNIQKQAIKFYKHLQSSDPNSYQYKALQRQESNKDQKRSPWTQIPGIKDNPQYINKKKSITPIGKKK